MTIEKEIAKSKELNTDEFFASSYSLESDRIVFYSRNKRKVFKFRDLMKDNYSNDNGVVDNKLEDIKSSLDMVWDDDIESFKLERVTDTKEDGEEFLKELQFNIPTEDEYKSETVLKVNNENGDFIAGMIKSRIKNDDNKSIDNLKKLKTEDIYVDDLSDPDSIYEKEQNYILSFKNNIKDIDDEIISYDLKEEPEFKKDIKDIDDFFKSKYLLVAYFIYWFIFVIIFGFVTIPTNILFIAQNFWNKDYDSARMRISFIILPIMVMYYVIQNLLKSYKSNFSYKKEFVKL